MGAGCSNSTTTVESSIVSKKPQDNGHNTTKPSVTLPLKEDQKDSEKDTFLEDLDTPTRHRRSDQELVSWVLHRFKNRVKISKISKAYERFVPREFIEEMGKQDIRQIELGNCIITERSILFFDVRGFTSMSEKIGSYNTFKFLNALARRVLPVVRAHDGYVDKFIGDAIVALFPTAEKAINAGFDIIQTIDAYNDHRRKEGYDPIHVGFGANSGTVMLGTIGDEKRMDGTAIGTSINICSQIEAMTKLYNITFIFTKFALSKLQEEGKLEVIHYRRLDRVKVHGHEGPLDIFEPLVPGSPLQKTKDIYENSLNLYEKGQFVEALAGFTECQDTVPEDNAARFFMNRCQKFIDNPPPPNWHEGTVYDYMDRLNEERAANHFTLMRLVFSAVFHLRDLVHRSSHSLLAPKKPNSPLGAPDSSDDDSDEESLKKIGKILKGEEETEATKQDQNGIMQAMKNTKTKPSPVDPALNEKNNKELISWVLTGFENHHSLSVVSESYQRFVPPDFLNNLGSEKSILSVGIGDMHMMNMVIMFIEVRGFSVLSRNIGAIGTLKLINSLSKRILPIVRENDGYVDNLFGEAIMALFTTVTSAMKAGMSVLASVDAFNEKRKQKNQDVIHVGIGVNAGPVMLGPVGDRERMTGTVIGNTVNVTSRLVSLTKMYGIRFVTSYVTIQKMVNKELKGQAFPYPMRELDHVKVVGRTLPVEIYDVMESHSPGIPVREEYTKAFRAYQSKDFDTASKIWKECVSKCIQTVTLTIQCVVAPLDIPSALMHDRAEKFKREGVPENWSGVETLLVK